MGISIEATKADGVVTITVSRALDRAHDDGKARTTIKASASEFAERVIGEVVSVRHNIEGVRGNRSVWTIEAKKAGLMSLDGKERKTVVLLIQDAAAAWAQKTFGRGAKVALKIE